MTVSRNIVFPSAGVVALEEMPVQRPAPTELLCAARRSLLSTGTESFCLAGEFDEDTFWAEWVSYPFSPGYSMVSTVLEVGASVTGFSVGDRIATTTPHAEFFAVEPGDAVLVPGDVTDEQAIWMSLACTTQLGVRRAELELGETVGVIGLGLLGQLVVQYLRLSGAARVVCIDTSPDRLELAGRNGATDLVLDVAGAAHERIADLTGGRMLDVVFDVTGHHSVLSAATTLVRQLGRVILLGDSPSPSRQRLGPRIVADSVAVLGVHASAAPAVATLRDRWTLPAMTELFFEYLRSGRMDVDTLISHRFSPAAAADVYEQLRVDRAPYLGVVFDWTELAS